MKRTCRSLPSTSGGVREGLPRPISAVGWRPTTEPPPAASARGGSVCAHSGEGPLKPSEHPAARVSTWGDSSAIERPVPILKLGGLGRSCERRRASLTAPRNRTYDARRGEVTISGRGGDRLEARGGWRPSSATEHWGLTREQRHRLRQPAPGTVPFEGGGC